MVDQLLINLARHFNATGDYTSSFAYESAKLAELGAVRGESAAIIAKALGQNGPMIELAIETAMLDAIREQEPSLLAAAEAGLLHGADVEMREGIATQLMSYSRQAIDQTNLVNTTMLQSTLDAYRAGVYSASDILRQMGVVQGALNAETGKVITGVSTLQQATRSAVKRMADVGIHGFVDRAGRKWTPEAYASMVLKTTSSNAANQAVFDRNAQYGNSYIWVSTNATARPGCAPWQGKVIDMADKGGNVPDFDGTMHHAYPVSATTYGEPDGIFGINCHHGPPNVFIPGFSYVRGEENKKAKAENDRLYQLTQEQRRLERQVRYAKRDAAMYDAAGDREAFEQAALKVKSATAKLRKFVDSHDSLVFSGEKVYTYGYNRSVSAKVSHVDRYERSFKILRSVGAKALNYDVEDKAAGVVYRFVEGRSINSAKTFAGYGGVNPLKEETLDGLCAEYGGDRKKWAHRKGIAYLDIDGEEVKAEVHWFQEESVGKVKFKVKRYIDED